MCWKKTTITTKGGETHTGKQPINPQTGNFAKANAPETWADFATACKAYEQSRGKLAGIGFMFLNSGYIGIDIDGIPREIREHQSGNRCTIVSDFVDTLQTYAEISQSGNGVHLIGRGTLPGKDFKNSEKGVEMYAGARFFVMTGNALTLHGIADISETVKPLYQRYKTKGKPQEGATAVPAPPPAAPCGLSVREIVDRAAGAQNGGKFLALYSGDISGYNSQSEADLAFCNLLAFWTGRDPGLMDAVFRDSGLMRQKWDRRQNGATYGAETIQKALSSCTETYEPRKSRGGFSVTIGTGSSTPPEEFAAASGTELPEPPVLQEWTSTGNARRIALTCGKSLLYVAALKTWYYYTGGKWQADETQTAYTMARDGLFDYLKKETPYQSDGDAWAKFCRKSHEIPQIEIAIRGASRENEMKATPKQFDTQPDLLNVKNGVINLETGETLPHRREYFMTMQTSTGTSETGEPPRRWLQFLDEIFDGDTEIINYVQIAAGYTLRGENPAQLAFFLSGNGNNGKSTFVDVLADVFGDYGQNVSIDTFRDVKRDGGDVSPDIAKLKGARLVVATEPEEGFRLHENLLKTMTGDRSLTGRGLYQSPITFFPEFAVWISTNYLPVIRGTDEGIWRRLIVIPFPVQIPAERVDLNLFKKLQAEKPAILSWLIEGARRSYTYDLKHSLPQAVANACKEYRAQSDTVGRFLEECTEEPPAGSGEFYIVAASDLYRAYTEWAERNGFAPKSSTRFGVDISKRYQKARKTQGVYYVRIRLKKRCRGDM